MNDERKLTVAELLTELCLDQIELNPRQPLISYVRAREVINLMPARRLIRESKMLVIEYLGGTKHPGELKGKVQLPPYVMFKMNDGQYRKAHF